jgi:hypothetical protein
MGCSGRCGAPLILSGPSPGKGRQQSRRELAAVHRLIWGLPRDKGVLSGDGLERLVAESFEEVVAAFEQLAREREARAVAADPLESVVASRLTQQPGGAGDAWTAPGLDDTSWLL